MPALVSLKVPVLFPVETKGTKLEDHLASQGLYLNGTGYLFLKRDGDGNHQTMNSTVVFHSGILNQFCNNWPREKPPRGQCPLHAPAGL